jgi:hypothetical protein
MTFTKYLKVFLYKVSARNMESGGSGMKMAG